jgi:hypothetical protein
MSHSPFRDKRAARLLSQVGDDITQLRDDLSRLISHTAHRTLPEGARDLATNARDHLAAGRSYAASRLRGLRTPPPREAAGIAGGVLLIGLLAFGAYALLKSSASTRYEEEEY